MVGHNISELSPGIWQSVQSIFCTIWLLCCILDKNTKTLYILLSDFSEF